MERRKQRHELAMRVRFVGCRVCGATDVTLYKDGDKRICKACRDRVSKSDTRKEEPC